MKVYVVYAHPREDSFGAACRDSLIRGLDAAGHEVRLTDLYADGFEPALSLEERRAQFEPPESKPGIMPYVDLLRWCEAIVFVYPTWWSAQPAILKGWFDRVWTSGVAYDMRPSGKGLRGKLHNIRRLVVVTTHGSSKLTNSLQGESGKRVVSRGLRLMCHPLARTKWVALYSVDREVHHHRSRFLDRVERTGRNLR